MSEGFGIISKMDPMARKAQASIDAMQKAIDLNNRDDIAKHLKDALNALAVVSSDLDLHDSLAKQMANASTDQDLGAIIKHVNTENDIHANDGAIALGVVRAGRTDKIYRPHIVY
jgi:hypothetical protein|tara:strand:- start:83 stop:427 length:345 start_codon:yes stop_codon:yes gene_type:complete